jgi:hypothetical protein
MALSETTYLQETSPAPTAAGGVVSLLYGKPLSRRFSLKKRRGNHGPHPDGHMP